MLRPKSISVALASALALFAAAAFAQKPPQQPAGGTVQLASLAQAIRVAEQETGGRARKAELESERGVDAYEIKTVAKDKSIKVLVDPASGKILRIAGPGFFDSIANLFDDDRREDQAALARLEGSPMTLVAAIAAAERETGGRAIKASLKSRHGQTLFEVDVAKDLAAHKVTVDPASGKVAVVARRKGKDDD